MKSLFIEWLLFFVLLSYSHRLLILTIPALPFFINRLLQISNDRYRQRVFLAKCFLKLKDMGSTWTMHIDTDEYVVPSKLFRQMGGVEYAPFQSMETPGSVLTLLQKTTEYTPAMVNYPCISLMHHTPGHNRSYHSNPKVIIDLAAIPQREFPKKLVESVHRPVKDYCHRNKELDHTNIHKQPIEVHHYLGSHEPYSGQNDKRRSQSTYTTKVESDDDVDDGVQPWLEGFVNSTGLKETRLLLGELYVTQQQPVSSRSWHLKDFLPFVL
jgi:hypothetical protein